MDDLINEVPMELRERFAQIVELTDAFCDAHLNDEYKQLSREMAVALCQPDTPVMKGHPKSWACGLIYTLGWVNFLGDPSQKPHMIGDEVAAGFGVSPATMSSKSMTIRKGMDLIPLDPNWCLPSRLDDNPLVWIIESKNGLLVDVRMLPREAQQAAFRNGLIPYIPADRNPTTPAPLRLSSDT